jgi:hypothetical protein
MAGFDPFRASVLEGTKLDSERIRGFVDFITFFQIRVPPQRAKGALRHQMSFRRGVPTHQVAKSSELRAICRTTAQAKALRPRPGVRLGNEAHRYRMSSTSARLPADVQTDRATGKFLRSSRTGPSQLEARMAAEFKKTASSPTPRSRT